MKFPFISRWYHEAVTNQLRSQVLGLAKLLYPEGVPEEVQLLLGITIPASTASTTPETPEEEPEETTDPEQQAEEEKREERIRRLTSLRRRSPSRVGPAIAAMMQQNVIERAKNAHGPASPFFAAVNSKPTN